MRGFFGFLPRLQEQVESLPLNVLDRINRPGGMNLLNLFDLIVNPKDYTAYLPDDPHKDSIAQINEDTSHLGYESINDGRTALCLISDHEIEVETLISSYFCPINSRHLPFRKIWTVAPNQKQCIIPNVTQIAHYESIRLTPDNLLPEDGTRLFHTCGSGDLIPALKFSGVLDEFLNEGGKYVVAIDLDSGFKGFDPRIIDHHICNDSHITCAVTERIQGDAGALLCHTMGFDQLVEQFNFTSYIECAHLSWISAGMMVFNADIEIDTSSLPWHRRKKIADKKLVIQYERSMSDLTSMFKTQFVNIQRSLFT